MSVVRGDFGSSAQRGNGVDVKFRFRGEEYHLTSREDRRGYCLSVTMTSTSQRFGDVYFLEKLSEAATRSIKMGLTFAQLLEGEGFDRTKRLHRVEGCSVKHAGTAWDVAYQLLKKHYEPERALHLRNAVKGPFLVMDGGKA